MPYNILFSLVFISQITVISFYYPRKLMKRAKSVSSLASNSSELESKKDINGRLRSFTILNNVMIVIGLIMLVLFLSLDLFETVTAVMAALGIFFLLQLSPLAISGVPNLIKDLKLAAPHRDKQQDTPPSSSKLFDFVSPLQVGIAVILFFVYLIFELLQWNGEWNTQLLKIGIFAFSNLFIAAMIARNLYAVRRGTDTNEEGITRYQDLKKVVPALIFISIGISVYSLAKQLLIDLDLHQLRPIMMSVFLQLLATLSFDRQLRDFKISLFPNITSNQSPVSRSRR